MRRRIGSRRRRAAALNAESRRGRRSKERKSHGRSACATNCTGTRLTACGTVERASRCEVPRATSSRLGGRRIGEPAALEDRPRHASVAAQPAPREHGKHVSHEGMSEEVRRDARDDELGERRRGVLPHRMNELVLRSDRTPALIQGPRLALGLPVPVTRRERSHACA
jgi:hypothetical protein